MAAKKRTVTNSRDFEYFINECARWIDFLGLYEWRIDFSHDNDATGAYGYCTADQGGGVAKLGLTKQWNEPVTKEQLSATARHEVLELLMWPMFEVAMERCITDNQVNIARHNVIRRLESVLDRTLDNC